MALDVRLLAVPFDANAEVDRFSRANPDAGGLVTFLGKVRPTNGVKALELRHYAPLTLPGMEALARTCTARWDVMGLLMVHRVGILHPEEPIVLVSAAARHRRDAFAAVDFAMDHLKSESWFWKREQSSQGEWHWVEPRADDFADIKRWG